MPAILRQSGNAAVRASCRVTRAGAVADIVARDAVLRGERAGSDVRVRARGDGAAVDAGTDNREP